jgi:dUTP pyrophosphatase
MDNEIGQATELSTKVINKDHVMAEIRRMNQRMHEIQIKVDEGGTLPFKSRPSDAGFDVYATSDITIYPGQVVKHPLNIRMHLPVGTWAEVTSKSGLGAKGLLVYAGVIDEEYRGVVHVIMSNINVIQSVDSEGFPLMRTEPIVIKKGDKLAQFIMNPYNSSFYVTEVQELDMNTSRGEGGFGSTGQ